MFVNELSKSEISTFAKLRISSHDLHIEKGGHRKTIPSERKCFLCGMAVEDEKHFVMECDSITAHINTFFNDLEEIVPPFSSKNLDDISFYNGM